MTDDNWLQSVSVAVVENFEIQQLVAVAVALKMGKKPDPTGLSNTNDTGPLNLVDIIFSTGSIYNGISTTWPYAEGARIDY